MTSSDHSHFFSFLSIGTVARGTVLSLTIRIGALGLGFAQAVLMARLLGPTGYGLVAVTVSAASIVASFALFGLSDFAVREVSRLRIRLLFGALRGFVIWAVVIVFLAAASGAAAIAGLAAITDLGTPPEISWGVALVPLMAMLILLRGVSQGFGRVFDAQAPTELVRPTTMVLALGTVLIFTFQLSVTATLILLIVANVLALGLAITAVLRTFARDVQRSPNVFCGSEWIRSAVPFFGIVVLATLHAELNTLLLGWLSGPEEAGLFQPVLRLTPIMLIAVQAMNMPLTPRISELWERDEKERLKHVVGLAAITTTMAAIATCAVLLILAPWILSAFGSAFTANVPALFWLAAAQIFNAACGPVANLLNMTGHQKQVASSVLAAIVVNLALGIWLIPQHGAYGAAIAMSASICVMNILMLREANRKLGFDPSLVGAIRRIGR